MTQGWYKRKANAGNIRASLKVFSKARFFRLFIAENKS